MKLKYLWIASLFVCLCSCSDNTGSLGIDMFSQKDQNINGQMATFDVLTQSQLSKDVFAKTDIAYVGKYSDPKFGYFDASFLAQMHCIDNFSFPAVCDTNKTADKANPNAIMVDDDIYRVELVFGYSKFFGDSLNACRLSVYQLSKDLNKSTAYFTNINPADYYSTSNLLGRKSYSATNLSISDSLRSLSTYSPSVAVTLPKSLGESIYKKSRECEKNNKNFSSVFNNMFKGIYVKSDYGDGTVLYLNYIEMRVVYKIFVRDSNGALIKKYDGKSDSTAYSYRTFAVTKEVVQANSFKTNETLINQRVAENGWTYLKTPAGIYTQAILPLDSIEKRLGNDTLNVSRITFNNYSQSYETSQYKFMMQAPAYVLMVREKDKASFFQSNLVNDDVTSFLAKHNYINTNQYVFSNISSLINTCLREKRLAEAELKAKGSIAGVKDANGNPVTTIEAWKEATQWNKVAILPVTVSTATVNNKTTIVGLYNDLEPSYAKLKGGLNGERLKLEITYTAFK